MMRALSSDFVLGNDTFDRYVHVLRYLRQAYVNRTELFTVCTSCHKVVYESRHMYILRVSSTCEFQMPPAQLKRRGMLNALSHVVLTH